MFEIFQDQDNEIIEKQIARNKIKKITKLSKLKTIRKKPAEMNKRNEQTVFSILKNLIDEEKELINQKNQLLDMEETLKKRIINEIDAKKNRVTYLQNELPDIKQRCEQLAKMLEIPVVK
jgi:hypothetical protein